MNLLSACPINEDINLDHNCFQSDIIFTPSDHQARRRSKVRRDVQSKSDACVLDAPPRKPVRSQLDYEMDNAYLPSDQLRKGPRYLRRLPSDLNLVFKGQAALLDKVPRKPIRTSVLPTKDAMQKSYFLIEWSKFDLPPKAPRRSRSGATKDAMENNYFIIEWSKIDLPPKVPRRSRSGGSVAYVSTTTVTQDDSSEISSSGEAVKITDNDFSTLGGRPARTNYMIKLQQDSPKSGYRATVPDCNSTSKDFLTESITSWIKHSCRQHKLKKRYESAPQQKLAPTEQKVVSEIMIHEVLQ